MDDFPTAWTALCGFAFLLGARHGFDADHLATIDGIARYNAASRPRLARSGGLLFSLGHGGVVIAVTVAAVAFAGHWQTPAWLDAFGVAISVAFLFGLAYINVRAVLRAAPGAVVRPAGFKGRLLGRLLRVDRPWTVAGVGALFALSFDTISQAALIALAASRLGSMSDALFVAGVFVLGMIVVDGLNGAWICHLVRRANRRAAIASRCMALAVAAISAAVGLFAIAKLLVPVVETWSERQGLALGAAVIVGVAAAFAVGIAASRRHAAQAVPGGDGSLRPIERRKTSNTSGNRAVMHPRGVLSRTNGMNERVVPTKGGVGAKRSGRWGAATLALAAGAALAQEIARIDPLDVTGHYDNSVGSSDAASAGVITPQLIADRPLLRPGNLLEYVPGMVVTQHSGAGKANQYFLRGFNLDHGTDFATWVAGMPVNLRTHGHGQGYTDLNFLIPELISRVDYFKGPYYANVGDFSSAGGAFMHYYDNMKEGVVLGTGGNYGYGRALLAGSAPAGNGVLTYGLEYMHNDGPWEVPEDFRKVNAILRYVMPAGDGKLGFTAMAYDGKWNSTDQVAKRAVDEGLIGRYGTLDASDGGSSSRYSFSVDYSAPLADGQFTTTAYWFKYRLNLFSNFTYFLDDPVNGDQFEQADDRNVTGWTGSWTRSADLFGAPTRNTLGFELRQDRIRPVGLYSTRDRERLSTTREDNVTEGSAGVYAQNDTQWNDGFRSILGIRYDWYRFDVDSIVPENSGNVTSGIASPKASLVFGPWYKSEYFVNAGYGFHSNDARGVTIRVDPKTGEPVDPATPLVRSKGAELGIRTGAIPNVQSSLALWYLRLDSELVFVGDAGTTEAGRPSKRYGVEWNTRWRPLPWMFVDLDLAWNRARFSDGAPEGDYIPGAPDSVVSAGVAVDRYGPWSAGVFLRYIGAYPLIEDNSVRSASSTVVDAQAGYEIAPKTRLRLDVFNVFNARTSDITYYYASRLPGEPAEGVNDLHFHPGEKRSFRVTLSYTF